MKLVIVTILLLGSTQAFAFTTLKCHVVEDVYPPSDALSRDYVVTANLAGPKLNTSVDVQSRGLNLEFGVETFVDSGGKQVVLIGGREITSKGFSTVGTERANLTYDLNGGELYVDCAVQE